MKKLLVLSLVVCLTWMSGCSTTSSTQTTGNTASVSYTAGTYTSTQTGMKSEVSVEVTFSEDSIVSIVVDHDETENIGEAAAEMIPAIILEYQTVNVDVISSATVTSSAIIRGVTDCIEQAGGDLDLIKQIEIETVSVDETFEYDIVVVGGGLAGLTAAVNAQSNGASVALIEKEPFVGGSSTMAEGYFFSVANGTEEDLYNEFLRRASTATSTQFPIDSMLMALVENSTAALESITNTGAQIEILKDFTSIALTAEGVIDTSARSAYLLIDSLESQFIEDGGVVYVNTPGTSILTDENNTIIGVESDSEYGLKTFYSSAVILASGDFANNEEMMEEYVPQSANCFTITAKGNTGDGILMALEVGAVMYDDQYVQGGPLVFNPYDIYRASYSSPEFLKNSMLVSLDGDRRVAEDQGTRPIHYVYTNWDQADGAWSIMDSVIAEGIENIDELVASTTGKDGIQAYKADTIFELALLTDMNPEVLIYNVERYNELVALGEDTDYGKSSEYLQAIETGPYYAVRGYAMNRSTIGGIETNENAEVVDEDGVAIDGLYAAGLISSRAFFSRTYDGGSALGIAATMGYVAGQSAADYVQ